MRSFWRWLMFCSLFGDAANLFYNAAHHKPVIAYFIFTLIAIVYLLLTKPDPKREA